MHASPMSSENPLARDQDDLVNQIATMGGSKRTSRVQLFATANARVGQVAPMIAALKQRGFPQIEIVVRRADMTHKPLPPPPGLLPWKSLIVPGTWMAAPVSDFDAPYRPHPKVNRYYEQMDRLNRCDHDAQHGGLQMLGRSRTGRLRLPRSVRPPRLCQPDPD